jgi:hypothetical protein
MALEQATQADAEHAAKGDTGSENAHGRCPTLAGEVVRHQRGCGRAESGLTNPDHRTAREQLPEIPDQSA